jgi:catechol O-methyltransferase
MDEFGTHYPMYKLGAAKGALLSGLVRDAAPARALELGTFLGYSALLTARALPPGGTLLCIEASAAHAAVARAVLELAGVPSGRVDILVGLAADALPEAARRLGASGADFVFLDHCKPCYLPDTQAMERLGLLRAGSVLAADNVVYPGAPDFLAWVDSAAGRYATRLLPAPFEYEQVWKEGWEEDKQDALSVSVRAAVQPDEAAAAAGAGAGAGAPQPGAAAATA